MKIVLLSLVVGLGASAFAETFKVDTTASRVHWKAGKKTGSSHDGEVKVKEGSIETNAKGQIQTAKIVIDMKTISNDDLKDKPDKQKQLVEHLSNDDFFKVDKFPESKFELKSITPKKDSKDEFVVKGDLTMIGKTQPVEFPAKITVGKTEISGTGTLKIERLKWGLEYGSGSIFKKLTADKIINDSFDLTLSIVAKK